MPRSHCNAHAMVPNMPPLRSTHGSPRGTPSDSAGLVVAIEADQFSTSSPSTKPGSRSWAPDHRALPSQGATEREGDPDGCPAEARWRCRVHTHNRCNGTAMDSKGGIRASRSSENTPSTIHLPSDQRRISIMRLRVSTSHSQSTPTLA